MSEMMQGTMQGEPTPTPIQDSVTPEPQYEDYWGVSTTERYYLPDKKQYFDVQPMNEGAKANFQRKTNKGIRVNQKSQDATLDVDPAGERWTLIKESVVDYFLVVRANDGSWSQHPYSPRGLEQWLEKANPKIVQDLEFFIRLQNPWMQAEMSLDDLYEQRDEVDKLIEQKRAEVAGEDSSTDK